MNKNEKIKCPECGSEAYEYVTKAMDSGKLAGGHECKKCGYEEIEDILD